MSVLQKQTVLLLQNQNIHCLNSVTQAESMRVSIADSLNATKTESLSMMQLEYLSTTMTEYRVFPTLTNNNCLIATKSEHHHLQANANGETVKQ